LEGPGRDFTITTADPAAGVDLDETVPAGRTWRIYFLKINFTTVAGGGQREVFLELTDGTNIIFKNDEWGTVGASATIEFYASDVVDIDSSGQIRQQQLPQVQLPAGYHIKTETDNLQAGDDFQASFFHVEEWIQPA